MRTLLAALLLSAFLTASAQAAPLQSAEDSDHDGLSDAVEDALLAQFAPQFMISSTDCSSRPAQFAPLTDRPEVQEENGTIYGQVFPRGAHPQQVEVHYYHLWSADCGELGHPLDAEHVSALLTRDREGNWKALYWYAAAHEDTRCDASQVAPAATVNAELRGPQIWISRGKHASFLNDEICTRGCGGDDCRSMQALPIAKIINLGEVSAPMNGATWTGSKDWPLAVKMRRSDFTASRIDRAERHPATITWASPGQQPLHAAIRDGNSAVNGVAASGRATDVALNLADVKTGKALGNASVSTNHGLAKALRSIGKALRITAKKLASQ